MLDPISEMLTRIRNAQMAGHRDLTLPASKVKMAIAQILEKEGFIELVQREKTEKHENLKITLKYNRISNTEREPSITGIKQASHQGKRVYVKKDEIKNVKNGYGIAIISTSQGIMTGKAARKLGLGGEFICEIW